MKPEQRCHYPECPRKRLRGWTTCGRHKTAGISIRQWNARQSRKLGAPFGNKNALGHRHNEASKARLRDSFTPERKRAIGERSKGNNYAVGHTVSAEQRAVYSALYKGQAKGQQTQAHRRARAISMAAALRSNPVPRDQYLMYWLDVHGIMYKYQAVIGGRYIADFLIGRMTIEVDALRPAPKPTVIEPRDAAIRAMRYGVLRIRG